VLCNIRRTLLVLYAAASRGRRLNSWRRRVQGAEQCDVVVVVRSRLVQVPGACQAGSGDQGRVGQLHLVARSTGSCNAFALLHLDQPNRRKRTRRAGMCERDPKAHGTRRLDSRGTKSRGPIAARAIRIRVRKASPPPPRLRSDRQGQGKAIRESGSRSIDRSISRTRERIHMLPLSSAFCQEYNQNQSGVLPGL
jgi:hypothetical protein